MANINEAMTHVFQCEYGNNVSLALEQCEGEAFLTYKGLQERDDADFGGWGKIHSAIVSNYDNKAHAAQFLESDYILQKMVIEYYKTHYCDKARLDEVVNQHTADEIMVAGVLFGMPNAVKIAQRVVGVVDDGVVGDKTLAALNAFDATIFDKAYDDGEIERDKMLIAKNPKLAINFKGWVARARAV